MSDADFDEVYDYVIVGAGSAGLRARRRAERGPRTHASRCSRPAARTSSLRFTSPPLFPALFKSSLDWDLLGEREPGLDSRRLYLPRGRMLGGCGSINAMIYMRGNRADYDGWAAARAPRAGAMTRCCRTSSAPRTTSAARTPSTASAARSGL